MDGTGKAMLNLNDLAVFVVAAEHKSFSEAGRRLHLSQPAVSQTIEKLEKEFDTRLFLRQGRRVRLSDTGLVLLPLARELLAGASRLEEVMACLQGEMIGEICVGCSTDAGKYLLPGLIADFHKLYPQVRFYIEVFDRGGVMARLLSGEISIAVSSRHPVHRDLEAQDFYEDEFCLIAAASHSWAGCTIILPTDLLKEPIILPDETSCTRQVLLDGLRRHEITLEGLNISMILGDLEAIVMAVEEQIGVAFVSRLAAARSLELGRVVEVQVSGMALTRSIALARSRRIPQTRAQAAFWNFVLHRQARRQIVARRAERQFV